MSRDQQATLLRFARESITAKLMGYRLPSFVAQEMVFDSRCGVFVTLLKKGKLRGCIGSLRALRPLYLAVQDAAISAALRDPRFSPLEVYELRYITIEISIISPLREIFSVDSIHVPQHGVWVKLGGASAVLLPQVAQRYHWSGQTLLEHVCMKAGLAKDSWQNPAMTIMIFEAEVFQDL